MQASAESWRGAQLAGHFRTLHEFLQRFEALWRPHAFQHPQLPWEAQFPELARRLRALSLDAAEAAAEDDAILIDVLRDDVPELASIYALLALPSSSAAPLPPLGEAVGVPGRKWRQLQAFAARVPTDGATLLEWCAGKAHLGRLLARVQHRGVVALEWDARLVASGEQLALREQLPVAFECVDVLQARTTALLQREHDVVALHACGELHLQLLRSCAARQPRSLTLAPCCYQLIPAERYAPLSTAAQRCDLQLTRLDLRTAVRDDVTSPLREREQRRTLQAWRLGFDAWLRDVHGGDAYRPAPSLPLSTVRDGFAAFCRRLAAHHTIEPPPDAAFDACERAGWERLREVAALDLARIAFRRPLELWLVLDRALYLQQHGYDVDVGAFCERALTPRNVMIRARRQSLDAISG